MTIIPSVIQTPFQFQYTFPKVDCSNDWQELIYVLDDLNARVSSTFHFFLNNQSTTFPHSFSAHWIPALSELDNVSKIVEKKVEETLPPIWKFWSSISRWIPNTQSNLLLKKKDELQAQVSSIGKSIKQALKKKAREEISNNILLPTTKSFLEDLVSISPSSSLYCVIGSWYQKNHHEEKAHDIYKLAFEKKKTAKSLILYARSLIGLKRLDDAHDLLYSHEEFLNKREGKLLLIEMACREGDFSKAISLCWKELNEVQGPERDSYIHKLVDAFILQSEFLSSDVLEGSLREIFVCFSRKSIYIQCRTSPGELLTVAFDAFDYILKKSDRGIDLFKSLLKISSFKRQEIETFIRFVEEKVAEMNEVRRLSYNDEKLPFLCRYMERFKRILISAIQAIQQNRFKYSWEGFQPGPKLTNSINEIIDLLYQTKQRLD